MSATNFNYTVALKEGLKSLQDGRLRQAEQSFRYLVDKFPSAPEGYRGLAKVRFEQDDRPSALRVLRDGAAVLSRAGQRAAAIALLREAISLDPRDFATHRRLAAALALAGDAEGAVQEYARFIRDLRDAGETDRAMLEATYAVGQLHGVAGAKLLEDVANGTQRRQDAPMPPARSEVEPQAADVAPARDVWAHAAPPPRAPVDPWSHPAPSHSERNGAPTAPSHPQANGAPSATSTVEPQHDEAPGETVAEAPVTQEVAEADDAEVEAAAARYLATRDPRAATLALEAARRYLHDGRTDAASDLLLQLIAAGVADHDAQRMLVSVARTLGKREVARVKCQLLVQALLMDGRNDLAAEVEALALAD